MPRLQQGGDTESGATALGLPAFEEVQAQLEDQLRSERQNEAVTNLVDELREGADVTVHL